jgi:hypothetical protein
MAMRKISPMLNGYMLFMMMTSIGRVPAGLGNLQRPERISRGAGAPVHGFRQSPGLKKVYDCTTMVPVMDG